MSSVKWLRTALRGLLAAICIVGPIAIQADAEQGRHWLASAEREYRSGALDRAEFNLRLAFSYAPEFKRSNAAALRLHGLIQLAYQKPLPGFSALESSLNLKSDARGHYLLASRFWSCAIIQALRCII